MSLWHCANSEHKNILNSILNPDDLAGDCENLAENGFWLFKTYTMS